MIIAALIVFLASFSTFVEPCTWTIDEKCFTFVNKTMSVMDAQDHCSTEYSGNLVSLVLYMYSEVLLIYFTISLNEFLLDAKIPFNLFYILTGYDIKPL